MARWTRVVALAACTGLLVVGAVGLANSASGSGRFSDPNDEKAAAETADAYDPGFSEEHAQYLENQVPLIELIEEVTRRAPGWGGGTLEGSRIDPLTHTVSLYWHGDTPEQLTTIITDAAADGIALNVVEISYTQEELALAVDRIVAAVGGVEGLAIGPAADLGGIEIQYPGFDGPTVIDGIAYDAIDTLRAAAGAEQAASGIPVFIGPGSPIALTGRANDTSPFWGGSVSSTAVGSSTSQCTTGFGMNAGSPYQYLLTAAHCSGFLDAMNVQTGASLALGYTDYIHELMDLNEYDLALVRITANPVNGASRSSGNRVFKTGPKDSTSMNNLTVTNVSSGFIVNPVGANYCSSGWISGYNCNYLVSSTGTVRIYAGGRYQNVVQFSPKSPATYTNCKGDSGGPIFFHNNGLSNPQITAAGIQTAGSGALPFGTPFSGAQCYATAYAPSVAVVFSIVPGMSMTY